MLRTVGLCVIVISGVGCGFAMSNELGRRKKMMEMILRMIILLRGEIRYGNKSLYDAFTGASGKLEGKYREFFILTAQKMKEKTGDSFGTIFRESAGKCLDLDCLSQEERDRFYSAWLSWTGYAAKTDGSDGKGNRICDQGTQERFL